ncbi:ATM interactor [Rhinophrynus dorsalis]
MKMHAEKKHKCDKCGSSYSTERDLKRHLGYCGKTFQCTCGCPYASRTALLSHIHRTGHEIPVEHREPPVKKKKIEASMQSQRALKEERLLGHDITNISVPQDQQTAELEPPTSAEPCSISSFSEGTSVQQNHTQTLLLPMPMWTFLKLPVMQLTHLPVLVQSSECSVKPVVVAVNNRGSIMTSMQILPQYNGSILPSLDTNANLPTSILLSRNTDCNSAGPENTFVQVSTEKSLSGNMMPEINSISNRNRMTSNVQTDESYFAHTLLQDTTWNTNDSLVSSCSQTDLSFSAQISLPTSVETQTLQPNSELPPSTKTEVSINPCLSGGISRETQTNCELSRDNIMQVDQAVMCENIFSGCNSLYTVSTQTNQIEGTYIAGTLDQNLLNTDHMKEIREETMKSAPFMNFSNPNNAFPTQNMTDNQTQTMELLSDLEKILSDNISGQPLENRLLSEVGSGGETNMSSNCTQNPGIDFDIDEFFSASNIQTQTDESELGNLTSEYLDIETQTDFLFSDDSTQSYSNKGNSNILGMEMFDTQTQTDLNFFLGNSSPLPLGSILKQSSFSMSTDSSDTECHRDIVPESKESTCHSPQSQVQHNSAETQTTDSCFETLGSLFLISNETQTAMDDFLLADLAWNTIESQFSSVETQTCEELFSLLSSEKSET